MVYVIILLRTRQKRIIHARWFYAHTSVSFTNRKWGEKNTKEDLDVGNEAIGRRVMRADWVGPR